MQDAKIPKNGDFKEQAVSDFFGVVLADTVQVCTSRKIDAVCWDQDPKMRLQYSTVGISVGI